MTKNPAVIKLKELTQKHNITQLQMSYKTLLPPSRLSQLFTEKRRFTIETDLKLCKLFNLEPLHFFTLQTQFELENAKQKYKSALNNIISL